MIIRIAVFCVGFLIGAPFAADGQAYAQGVRAGIFLNDAEAAEVRDAIGRYPLLDRSIAEARAMMDAAIDAGVEVPEPGEAGGYEHERHKQNYREMYTGGLLYAITGEERYAGYVRDLFEGYARLYPTLGPHPLAHHQLPGKIFHQVLNDNVFLVHASIGYDTVYGYLSDEERERFEENIFRPMVAWLTREDNYYEFNRIHNHGTWTVAAAGMMAYVLGDEDVVQQALHGTDLSGEGGFLRQLDELFSPDGFYMEGPYYIRYAMMPFVYFAEAIQRMDPEQKIFEYRDGILHKAVRAAVQTAMPNGVLPPINNASKTMDVRAPEVVLGTDVIFDRFGDRDLLGVASIQQQVILNGAGLAVAKAHAEMPTAPEMTWESIELRDGPEGDGGGLGILRTGEGEDQSMLLMKYGVHGGGHGHYDKLHFLFFDQGREVIPDYGFGRWINVEPKWGGRYLPEGRSYAPATIAHNTVVVDERTQNDFDREEADQTTGKRHFFDASNPNVQIMSARADDHYDGVEMQRTMLLLEDESLDYPIVVDLYRLRSEETHQYDYPIHFTGQPMLTSFEYERPEALRPLGSDHGYQHLWEEGRGRSDELIQFTWLDGNRYYTLHTAGAPQTEAIFARIGSNDPDFNLRSEPALILRRDADTHLFASVIEPHGYFNEAREVSRGARPSIRGVEVVGHDDDASVVRFWTDDASWTVVVNNGPSTTARTDVSAGGEQFVLQGNYAVDRQPLTN